MCTVSCPSGYTQTGSSSGTSFCDSGECSQGAGAQRKVYVTLTCRSNTNGNVYTSASGYMCIGCC